MSLFLSLTWSLGRWKGSCTHRNSDILHLLNASVRSVLDRLAILTAECF